MIKFILPAVIVFLTILFWEKICDFVYKKFKIKLNYLITSAIILFVAIIILLVFN